MGAAHKLGGELHDAVISVQEDPGQVLHVCKTPLAHLPSDCADMLLLDPNEYESDWAQLVDGQLTQGGCALRAHSPRNFPAWID